MKITKEEELMYGVMKAIYDGSIPIDFKGSMVLKACLSEAGYSEEIRHTLDIDGNWCSDLAPTAEQMTKSLQAALQKGKIDLNVELYRMYGDGRSAGFELREIETNEILFTMDIDVNRLAPQTRLYEISGFRFRGVLPSQMLADKISTISSDKIFRRIKDIVDVYYISKVFEFNKEEITKQLSDSERLLDDFNGFINRTDDLRHAYEKFRFTGDVNKPSFDEVYNGVKCFINDILPK